MAEIEQAEKSDAIQLLTSKERQALKEFLSNGRDWLRAVQAVYNTSSLDSALAIASRLRRKPAMLEVLAHVDGHPNPTPEDIGRALYRIGINEKASPRVRVTALDIAAILFGYKQSSAEKQAEEEEKDDPIARSLERLGKSSEPRSEVNQ